MRNFLRWVPLLASVLCLAPFHSSVAKEREVTVAGHCSRMVTADRASIVVTAEFVDKDLRAAIQKATEAYDRTRDGVKKLGLENLDLATSEYSVSESREWEKDKSVFKGYRARMGLKVSTSSIARVGEVIALAAKEGLQDVGSLNTFLSDEKYRKEQFACLRDAAEDARSRARELAGSLNARLGDVVTVNEVGAPTSPPIRPLMEANVMMKRASPEAPTVEAGQQQIEVTVQAVFALQ